MKPSRLKIIVPAAALLSFLILAPLSWAGFPAGPSGGPTYSAGTVSVANAFDGNPSTYWQGAYNAANPAASTPFDVTSWRLIYGYAGPKSISNVTVTYATDSRFIATNATIDCSSDGSTWTTRAAVPAALQSATVAVNGVCQWISLAMSAPSSGYTPAVSDIVIAATDAPPPDPATASSYAELGDSITAGSYAPISYTTELPIFREGPTYTNMGVSGNTTQQMLARMSDVLGSGAQVVILMGGTNDCQFGWPTATTMGYVDQIETQAARAGRAVVLVGPLPRDNVSTSCLLNLRSALASDVSQHGLTFVDPWTAFEKPAGSGQIDPSLTEDGIHPNGRGAFMLARVIAHALGWGFAGD